MKNVSLTFSIQVSGLKCHYEQYFSPAQPLLPGGGLCATPSVFPFPLQSTKICICLLMFSKVTLNGSPLLDKSRMLLAGSEGGSALPWPCPEQSVEALVQLLPDKANSLPGWHSLPAFWLKAACPRLKQESGGCGGGSHSVLSTAGPFVLRAAPGISVVLACLFWPAEERGSASELLLREAS